MFPFFGRGPGEPAFDLIGHQQDPFRRIAELVDILVPLDLGVE
jgi:hypothetical protein